MHSHANIQEIMDAEPDTTLQPPIELTDTAAKFWPVLVGSKPASEWSPSDLLSLAELSEVHAELEIEKRRLKEEGHVIINQGNNEVRNPRSSVVSSLRREIMQIARFLAIAPGNNANKATKVARAIKENADDDDLIN